MEALKADVSLDEDVLVGTLLAFFIDNSMSQGQGETLRWCPVLSELGVSSCEVTQITARRGTRLPTRKQIRFGHQRKGVMGWDLSNGRDSTLRQMVRVIVQKSDESTKLFERMSAKSGKDRSTTQRAKTWAIMHDEQRPWVVLRQEWEVAISTKHKLLMLN